MLNVGVVMDDLDVTQLPLKSRDTFDLLQLQPGVQGTLGADLFFGNVQPLCNPSLSFETCLIMRRDDDSKARASYGKFLIDAATRYRHAFGAAVTLAIMGYHFYTVTEDACRTG